MGIWAWITRRPSGSVSDFEMALKTNDDQIQLTATSIRNAKRGIRETNRSVVKYSLSIFMVGVGVAYAKLPRRFDKTDLITSSGLVLLIPLSGYILSYVLDFYYSRKIANLENRLEDLKASKDDKIAEFKKITNFSKLHELVARYDETPIIDLNPAKEEAPQPIADPQLSGELGYSGSVPPLSADIAFHKKTRSVVDRVCDFLLNDGPSNRYALICSNCFTHNGLVLPEDLDWIRYRCCLCGMLNCRADDYYEEQGVDEHSPAENEGMVQEEDASPLASVKRDSDGDANVKADEPPAETVESPPDK